jgi:hypothetical protein
VDQVVRSGSGMPPRIIHRIIESSCLVQTEFGALILAS